MPSSFGLPAASALGVYTYRGPRIALAPASALNGTEKFLDLAIEHGRLFEVDGVAGPGLDEQPGRRNGTFQEHTGLEAGVVLIADNDQRGDRQRRKLLVKIVQGRSLALVVSHRQRRSLSGML